MHGVVAVTPARTQLHHHAARHQEIPPVASWRASWIQITTRMLELSWISNVAAVLCALLFGWANPFLGGFHADDHAQTNTTTTTDTETFRKRVRASQHTAVLMTAYIAALGMASSCLLISFFIHGRRRLRTATSTTSTSANPSTTTSSSPLSVAQSVRIILALTWRAALVLTLAASATTYALIAVGVPVVKFNCHTLVGVLSVALYGGQAIVSGARFRRRCTVGPRPIAAANVSLKRGSSSAVVVIRHSLRRASSKRSSWRSILRVSITNVLPTMMAAVTGMLYVSTARRLDLQDRGALLAFGVGSVLLKFLLQTGSKLLAGRVKGSGSNIRNLLYIITSPILMVEINIRLAMLRVTSTRNSSVNLYTGTALLGIVEISIRLLTVVLDLVVIAVAKRKLERTKRRERMRDLHAHQPPTALLNLLDDEFARWKLNHLHLCAVEVMAEMVAEHCAIGFACVYMVLLRNNPAFDLALDDGDSSKSDWIHFVGAQLVTYAVQLVVELWSDLLASTVEIRMGIRVDHAFGPDDLTYIRWTVLVVAIHAGGVSISSLLSIGGGGGMAT